MRLLPLSKDLNPMADYKFHHDPARCVSCGLCEAFCPCYVLQMQDGAPVAVNPDA